MYDDGILVIKEYLTMPIFQVDLVCQVCGALWKAEVEGDDEGDALFRCIAEASKKRCTSCTSLGQFELQRSSPKEQ